MRLGLVFGALAFLQGMADPAEGLFAQPALSLLRRGGQAVRATTDFAAIVGLPWVIKPVFGLISDALPISGSRRKSYLILSAGAAFFGFLNVYASLANPGHGGSFLGWLVLATAGVAFSDVVSDALMIETGQPRGMTGRFQSIQWSCTYAAAIATGYLGGWFSKHRAEKSAIAICGAIALILLLVSFLFAREPPRDRVLTRSPRAVLADLGRTLRLPSLWASGAFLFLWNFNPFSFQVLRSYMTEQLGLGEDFYGAIMSLFALACLAASLAYGFYCRLVPMRWLVHASIALGVLQTMAYWGLVGQKSAIAITIFAGLTYMTATLIQLDLAARICPPEVAGTAFALLMAMENLATTGSVVTGGRIYDWWGGSRGYRSAYMVLVGVGVATTAACWLLVPLLPDGWEGSRDGDISPGA